jgi:hypothetical protein
VAFLRAAVLILAAGVLAAPAKAQTFGPAQRPHAGVLLRDRGVALARFDSGAHVSRGQVVLHLTLTARSRPGAARRYVLRAGACRGQISGHVTCPPSFARAVTLSPRRTTIVTVNVRFRAQRGRRHAAFATLAPAVNLPPTRRGAKSLVASLMIPDRAWLSYPDRRFGLRISRPWEGAGSPIDVRSVSADATQVSADTMFPALAWSMRTSQSTDVTTVASACGGRGACPQQTSTQTVDAGVTARFAGRPKLLRSRPGFWSYLVRSGDGVLLDASMPWPV